MSLDKMQYEELIQYCKDNDLDYLTKAKKPKAHATLLKELSNTVNTDIQTNNLELIIKQCHNYLYKSAGIVGSKAQNDIMRILIIRIFNILLSNKNEYIEKLLSDYKETNSILKDFKNTYNEDINNITNDKIKIKIQKHLNYIDYLYDINNILEYKGNAIEDEWKEFIIYCVSDILKNIYSKDDYSFNTPNSYDINELIKIISKININDDFINNFAEHNGDIHEYLSTSRLLCYKYIFMKNNIIFIKINFLFYLILSINIKIIFYNLYLNFIISKKNIEIINT